VTGAAGFIGSHLTEALLADGWRVRALDNLSGGRRANLAAAHALAREPDQQPKQGRRAPGRLTFKFGDVLDAPLTSSLIAGCQAVFHLAGMASAPQSQLEPERCLDINGRGTLNVMRAAAEAGVRRLVYASSSAVYGDLPTPHVEGQPLRPNTPYAAVKLLGEHLALFFQEQSGLTTVSLRFFNVYGPRQSPDGPDAGVVPIFAKAFDEDQAPTIFGDGRQTRDFIHVRDVVKAAVLAAQTPDPGDGIFNVATGHGTTVLEVADLMRRLRPGRPAPIFAPARAGDPLRSEGDPAKAAAILGFRAVVPLAQGLAELLGEPSRREA
jgi:UDP-glucose 4-epimerase